MVPYRRLRCSPPYWRSNLDSGPNPRTIPTRERCGILTVVESSFVQSRNAEENYWFSSQIPKILLPSAWEDSTHARQPHLRTWPEQSSINNSRNWSKDYWSVEYHLRMLRSTSECRMVRSQGTNWTMQWSPQNRSCLEMAFCHWVCHMFSMSMHLFLKSATFWTVAEADCTVILI